jgi:hypothetical protein
VHPIDRVRRDLGLPTSGSVPSVAPAPKTLVASATLPSRRHELRDILDRSVRSDDVPIELGSLSWMSWLALGLAVVVAAAHRPAMQWVLALPAPIAEFLRTCATFRGVDRWGPWAALATAVGLAGCAAVTRGFRQAPFRVIVAIGLLDVSAAVLAVPLALSAAAGLLAVAVIALITVAVMAFGLMLLFGASGD